MNALVAFKNQIFIYGIIITAIFEVVSLPFLGLDLQFFYGLILGTTIAIVNFNILEFTLKKTLEGSGGSITFIGYIIRLALYGIAFYTAMKVSTISGIGVILGFVTLKLAIFYLHGIKTKFSQNRKLRPEVKAEYERMDAEKQEHKSERLRDKIRDELKYKENEEFFGESKKKVYRAHKKLKK